MANFKAPLLQALFNEDGSPRVKRPTRQPKLSRKLISDTARHVLIGLSPTQAGIVCGVSEAEILWWQSEGRRGNGTANKEARKELALYIEFVDTMAQAEATYELLMVQRVYNGQNAEASLAMLERRFPERWAVKSQASE